MKIRGQTVYTLEQRLKRLSVVAENGCHEWQSCLTKGYGRLVIGSRTNGTRRTVSAHRLAYEVFKGPIPTGLHVCHHCDNRCCINPDHLFVGTRKDNIDDRERKGRNNTPKGEKNPQNKLKACDILFIRKSTMGNQKLAKFFGVNKKTISQVKKRQTWEHVKDDAKLTAEQ